MEYNKNKIIFFVVWIVILISIVFLLMQANKDNWNNNSASTWNNNFNIWMVSNDSNINTYDFVTWFKELNPSYKNTNIVIETFPSYEDYNLAMVSAINAGKWPDLFVMNNSESVSVFDEQILWISSDIINPNDFRKKYAWFFSDDLILSSESWEFLKWLPVWYETLWVFYNRIKIRNTDLETLTTLNNKIQEINQSSRNTISIWLWNGSTVEYAWDIVTQLLMLEDWVNSIESINDSSIRQVLGSYFLYWDTDSYNKYNNKFLELSNLDEKSLYLFSKWDIHMVVWYPSMINDIKEYGYSKTYLLAEPFPHYYSWEGNTLVNYNYFVINKDTQNLDLAYDLLSYLSTDVWANSFLSIFPYKLPALLSLLWDKLEQKIHPDFNVTLSDFYNEDSIMSSFDKWIMSIYDREIIDILDDPINYQTNFSNFLSTIKCKLSKVKNLSWFSQVCE